MTAGLFWHGEPWLRDEDLRQQREALATEMLIQRCRDQGIQPTGRPGEASLCMIAASQELDWVEGIFDFPLSDRSASWSAERQRITIAASMAIQQEGGEEAA